MAYLRIPETSRDLAGFGCGCGPSCGCGPRRQQYSGLGEWYVRDDEEEEEPERVPPPPEAAAPPAPPQTSAEPTPPKHGRVRHGRRRGAPAEPAAQTFSGWGLHGYGC